MATIIPQKFLSKNNVEYDTEQEANLNDVLFDAENNFNHAKKAFENALAETCRTADGELFKFGLWRNFYYPTYDGRVRSLSWIGLSHYVDYSERGTTVRLGVIENDKIVFFNIGEMYASKKKATAEAIRLLEDQVKYVKEDYEKIKE